MDSKDFNITQLGPATIDSPLTGIKFIPNDSKVAFDTDAETLANYVRQGKEIPAFEKAGPREKLFHDPAWSKAAILTAGGLCPGLNDVIKFLVSTLYRQYKVQQIYGIRYGYRGLNPVHHLSPILLTDENTDAIHEEGGTILASSRGEEDSVVIVDTLVRMNINLLFCIGGDGTARGAHDIAMEIAKRKLSISVITIPKTIDNDISFIDKSFGFETAVAMAASFVSGAHNEAKGAYNGIGLIKVMGRDSGFIAAYATLANSYVNCCLVPEQPFVLGDGSPDDLLVKLEKRLAMKKHAVIMVAEGAGQDLFEKMEEVRDASGNVIHKDIGLLLKNKIKSQFKAKNMEVNVKYFDLSYTIRSVPAHGEDAVFCAMLAQNAVHAAMAGRTDMIIGHWGDNFTHVPIPLATKQRKKIDLDSQLWTSVKAATKF
ncbi:MAG: ATP-dependent 6-phosphofructokinase [Lentisphaeria bacterium]|nr:ATP-dependent 6-phosphofructokinase [Lentisphaeria bacterium]